MTINIQPLAGLTETQRLGLRDVLVDVSNARAWSWELPVLLRNRCWLRLDRIQLNQLLRYIPPDGRDEAPELTHYQQLIAEGSDPLLAQQRCWQEFGMDDCQRALHEYWQSRDNTNHGWTAQRYRELVSLYREHIEQGVATVPMLVLARQETTEKHQIHWITETTPVKGSADTKPCCC
ncbi:hypothetical protein [Synechococcus sp. UW179A]|uniref:hypothetical protein n=1 Tax=Synechococcus sp. UW179A TaxID=2575510 RepID=UPI001FCA5236|nr:hypothetical protein [Synechococcus sp. UW179A]